MKIIQIIPAPPKTEAKYLVADGERLAKVVGYALIEFKSGNRVIRPVIDWGQPHGAPDILARDGNVILEEGLR